MWGMECAHLYIPNPKYTIALDEINNALVHRKDVTEGVWGVEKGQFKQSKKPSKLGFICQIL